MSCIQKCCFIYSEDSGATQLIVSLNSNGINRYVKTGDDATLPAPYVAQTVLDNIDLFLAGSPLPVGVIVEKSACVLQPLHYDDVLCFSDTLAGTALIKAKVGLGINPLDATIVEEVKSVKTLIVNDLDVNGDPQIPYLPADTIYTGLQVTYLSGSYATNDLVITANGLDLYQVPCVECATC